MTYSSCPAPRNKQQDIPNKTQKKTSAFKVFVALIKNTSMARTSRLCSCHCLQSMVVQNSSTNIVAPDQIAYCMISNHQNPSQSILKIIQHLRSSHLQSPASRVSRQTVHCSVFCAAMMAIFLKAITCCPLPLPKTWTLPDFWNFDSSLQRQTLINKKQLDKDQ